MQPDFHRGLLGLLGVFHPPIFGADVVDELLKVGTICRGDPGELGPGPIESSTPRWTRPGDLGVNRNLPRGVSACIRSATA